MFARSLTPATGLSLVALFIALGGTSYAVVNSGIPDTHGLFHACVNRRTGAVRLVSSASDCKRVKLGQKAEAAVAWNQRGPSGPAGPTGPSDGYFAQSRGGVSGVSVSVPAGDYIASGGCTATREAPDTQTSPTFALADAILSSSATPGPQPPFYGAPGTFGASASVPDMGAFLAEGTGVTDQNLLEGSASLSDSGALSLPKGGTITQRCADDLAGLHGGSTVYANLYLSAIRVGSLHQTP